ncbi:MAG: SagB family peptide dehydrogenase [Bryobacteraceae bacterium]|nr:SagB family peptide dehydrogenase [Bryobacteraceae bacterium]
MSRHERHSIFALPPSEMTIVRTMKKLRTVKPYRDYPKVALPESLPASSKTLDEVVTSRATARQMSGGEIFLPELAKTLYMSYAVTRTNEDNDFPRPFRTIPSGGALYPLEIYLHASRVHGLDRGLYHFDPEDLNLDVLRTVDESERIANSLFQPELALSAAAILMISAVFVRSTFKYGDRGYRFILIEAGHMVQNAVLVASELGLTATPVGGYLDREMDRYLGLDGITESVVYMLLLGAPEGDRNSG